MRGLLRGIEEQRENGLGEEEGAPSMSHQRHLISQGPARGKRAVFEWASKPGGKREVMMRFTH